MQQLHPYFLCLLGFSKYLVGICFPMAVKSMCSSHKQGLVVSEFQFQISRRKNEISSALGHMFTQFSSVAQSCPTLWTPWTAAHQASLSIINSQSLLKLMSIESVMPSNPLILCCRLLLPSVFPSRVFSSESVLLSGGQSIGVSASASVLPMNFRTVFF